MEPMGFKVSTSIALLDFNVYHLYLYLLDLRTNAETAGCHEQQSAWRSGSNDPPV